MVNILYRKRYEIENLIHIGFPISLREHPSYNGLEHKT